MAVYYKFKSAKDYDSIPMDGHFMSVANLKERIFESKHLGRGTDFDLVVTNAQTNEEYLDEAMLIPKNTSVLIRRVPGRPRMPIVAQPDELVETKIEETQQINNATAFDSFVLKDLEPPEWDDDFGNDLYATIPEMKAAQVSNPIQDVPAPTKADEDSKIRALIETPALDWQRQAEGFGSGRGSGRGGRMMGGRGIGRGILERKTPPQGYICHRCKVPGHFIQHCPTNGDPNYDIRRVKPPTGIPKSMLMATPDGSYALPSGASAVLRPNEAAFEKEIEGLPTSSRPVGDVPPELRCPLCKDVMKDAVLTSKCCFTSFCDKCIRDHIMSKSMCVCGANDVLADDLLPNKTLRNTINGILEAKDVSGENAGSGIQVPDMESARPRAPSPTLSAASRGDHQIMQPMQSTPAVKDTSKTMDIATEERPSGLSQPGQPQLQLNQLTVEGVRTAKIPDVSEATRESASAREAASQGSAPPPVEEEVQQKMAAAEGKKKKKKKARLPVNSMPMEPQWRNPQDIAAENYMMQQMGPAPYRPYWDGMQQMHQMQQMQQMQPGLESYMQPFPACPMPYNNMGFGMGPMDVPPFGGVFPHDPFMAQNLMFHPPPPFVRPPPQRDLADFGMGFNPRPPLMSREEFEARKADLRRKREMERMGDREMPMNMMTARDRDHGREVSSSTNGPLTKPKLVNRGPPESMHEREQVLDHRHQDSELPNRHSRGGGGGSVHHMERTSPERGGRHLDRISPERGGKRLDRISPERGGNRWDKISPERPRPDPDHLSRKRKSSSDHRSNSHRRSPSIDAFDHRDHRDSSEHHHQRRPRSRSSSKPPSAASEQVPPSHPHTSHKSSSSAEDKLLKKSVFSRISFPEGGVEPANKKRKSSTEPKSSFSKDRVAAASTSSHASVSNGYTRDASPVVTRKSQLSNHSNYIEEVDYESSDDDRHFKRRPSRYEPSPPAPRMVEVAAEMDGGKRSKRDRDRGGHSSRHRS